MSSLLETEIREQPAVARRLLERTLPRLGGLGALLRRDGSDEVLLVARGSSDNAARYAAYLWGLRARVPTSFALPSLTSVHGVPPVVPRHAVVAVSQSGASPDVVAVVEGARTQRRPTLAVTNDVASPLAGAADDVLDLGAGPERSVAATKTFTSSLLALALLGVALDGRPTASDRAGLDAVPDALEAVVSETAGLAGGVGVLAGADRAVCVGRGLHLGVAHETALKLTELTGTLVAPFSPADLLHGPVAAVGPDVPVVVLAPDGLVAGPVPGTPDEGLAEVVEEVRRRDAPVVAVAPASAPLPDDVVHVAVPSGARLEPWLAPLVSVVPGQLLALEVARVRGVDLDRPGGLSKVTRTR